MKIIATILALVIIGLIAASYFVFSEAGNMTKAVMEKVIPEATGTPFAVESVDIAFLEGGASIKGFKIGNPSGYKTENAISFEQVAVGVDIKSILTDLVVVDQVVIANPQINFEKTLKGSNIGDIQKAVEKFVSSYQGTDESVPDAAPEETSVEETAPAKKIAIKEFVFEEGKIFASIPTGDSLELAMPSFTIKDLGTDGSGVTGEALIQEVLTRITAVVMDQTKNIGANMVNEILENPENAKKVIEDTIKGGGSESIDKIKKGFGGLLQNR